MTERGQAQEAARTINTPAQILFELNLEQEQRQHSERNTSKHLVICTIWTVSLIKIITNSTMRLSLCVCAKCIANRVGKRIQKHAVHAISMLDIRPSLTLPPPTTRLCTDRKPSTANANTRFGLNTQGVNKWACKRFRS